MNGTLRQAREAAVKRNKGGAITPAQQANINYWVNKVSPENFYMDGEIFADYAGYGA